MGCHQGNASVAAQPLASPSGLVVPPASQCASVHSVTTVFGSVRPPIGDKLIKAAPSHPPCGLGSQSAACWAGDIDCDACEAAARARDAEAFKGGMTVKEINAAFGERAGELKKPAKRVGLIDMGLIHLFMM